jgi:hypothetical protein
VNLYFGSSLGLSDISTITPIYAPTGKQSTGNPRGGNSEGHDVAWLRSFSKLWR